MDFEWDPSKAASNQIKHRVDFADAAAMLEDDELALTVHDPDFTHEERFVSIGRDPQGRLLVVIFTFRAETLRIISARRATGAERRRYERKL